MPISSVIKINRGATKKPTIAPDPEISTREDERKYEGIAAAEDAAVGEAEEATAAEAEVTSAVEEAEEAQETRDQRDLALVTSKHEYLFGRFDMQMKLVPGNSAGTVTTFYLSSQGAGHDEIDFEFLGNSSGNPYTIHTNVYAQGKGDKEQQFRPWFDPTAAFHTYTIVWNTQRIIFLIDNIPIRVFESSGVPFPNRQPMRVYASLWNADDWATQGGRVKTDWTKAPFTASYMNFNADANMVGPDQTSENNNQAWSTQGLDAAGRNRIRWVHANYMIYNYCTDNSRFPAGLPPECKTSKLRIFFNMGGCHVSMGAATPSSGCYLTPQIQS
ncbi:hypothetical protein E3N88_35185 [Mikania micrantha]|uniref:Xyloglucan endotransglucosylase/hydrolase n=1 Tax=Mikania micrantha TaxID=192012 RepID=A0A5N6M094_9ASTR|nr:hypothetical protein E3N88_35185 [Mikania micrantha]